MIIQNPADTCIWTLTNFERHRLNVALAGAYVQLNVFAATRFPYSF